jgi:hypothetical protein
MLVFVRTLSCKVSKPANVKYGYQFYVLVVTISACFISVVRSQLLVHLFRVLHSSVRIPQ